MLLEVLGWHHHKASDESGGHRSYLGETMPDGRTRNYFCAGYDHPSERSRAKQPRLASWFCLFQTALVASYYDYSEKRERYQLLVHGVVVWTVHIKGMRTSSGPRGCSVNTGH